MPTEDYDYMMAAGYTVEPCAFHGEPATMVTLSPWVLALLDAAIAAQENSD